MPNSEFGSTPPFSRINQYIRDKNDASDVFIFSKFINRANTSVSILHTDSFMLQILPDLESSLRLGVWVGAKMGE